MQSFKLEVIDIVAKFIKDILDIIQHRLEGVEKGLSILRGRIGQLETNRTKNNDDNEMRFQKLSLCIEKMGRLMNEQHVSGPFANVLTTIDMVKGPGCRLEGGEYAKLKGFTT